MRGALRRQATEYSPGLSRHVFERVVSIAADPVVKAAVEDNHDENRWWPTAISDWRLRMAVAGWGTRVSYHMIDTYAQVVAVVAMLSWERLTALPDRQIAGIVRPLGLRDTRIGYLRSLADFLANLDRCGVDPLAMNVDDLIMRIARDVKYAGYNIAQCATLYSRGYHCGVIPVDSGMVTKLAPFLGIRLDHGAIAHEQLRMLLEACVHDRGDAYRDLAYELGYQVTIPQGVHPSWWLHLVLVYFKRLYLNRPGRQLCAKRPACDRVFRCGCAPDDFPF